MKNAELTLSIDETAMNMESPGTFVTCWHWWITRIVGQNGRASHA